MTGLIADIQRACVHDGPGIRTTVFFKGCPLNCAWCHNPECISFQPEILHYQEKCIGCGFCDDGCFSGAKVVCGKEMTVDALMDQILLDKAYYGADGGVTFSGGEPLAQKAFLKQVIAACREEGIHVAIESSLLIYDEEVFASADYVMADLKIWDTAIHKRYTGIGNETIKENFLRLNELVIPIEMRTPVIPEIMQDIAKISAFARSLPNVVRYTLLPYHPLGNTKRKALGLPEDGFTIPTNEFMKELEAYVFLR